MAQDINEWIGIGRLTRDAEMRYTSGGMAITNFSIAVNRRKKQGDGWKDEASFLDCVLFGKLGETLNQYMVKGKQIAVTGSLEQQRWEKDGQNHSKVVINADNIQLLGGDKKDGAQTGGTSGGYASGKTSQNDSFPDDGFVSDIPF